MSNSVQHRIITAFPKMQKWADYELIILNLIYFFEGEKIHVNDSWKCASGHYSLRANAIGRKVLRILKTVNIRVSFGNDAPRGGAVGAYFKCARKNATASKFFSGLLNEIKVK